MIDDAAARRYAAFYCEENVWWLAQEPRFAERACDVVLVTNSHRSVAVFAQRAGRGPDRGIVWDYHVVLAMSNANRGLPGGAGCRPVASIDGEIWDLDCVVGAPLAARAWLDASFPRRDLPTWLEPRFRVVPAVEFVATFSSDRGHMRDRTGRWRAPPPPWPCIVPGPTNLDRFLDLDDPFVGDVVDLETLRARLTGAASNG